MKILITGGSGYIGSNLIPRLLAKKHKVKIIIDVAVVAIGGSTDAPLIGFS